MRSQKDFLKIKLARYAFFAVALLLGMAWLSMDQFAVAKSDRQSVIDFEDALVEGVNKRPFDSLSQISEKEKKRRKLHLYRKRVGFSSETRQTLKEMRYVQ